jgi:hypothetical protein
MKSFWNFKVLIASAVVICGIAFASSLLLKRAKERNLVDHAKTIRVEAELGDASAEAELGHLYYHGLGVALDYSQAASWFRKAADKGDPRGQYDLAYMYRSGQGVPKDLAEAARWARKAADQGNAKAEFAIGSSYYYGQGVPQDRTIAASWYRKAADHGYAEAQYDLGYMLYYGQGVAQDRAEANRLFHQAADQGNENAQRTLRSKRNSLSLWIGFFVTAVGGLLLLASSLPRRPEFRGHRRQATALAGLFVLAFSSLDLFHHFDNTIVPYSSVDTTLLFVRNLLGGVSIVTLFIVVLSRRAQTVLVISSALFLVFNLCMFIAFGLSHREPTVRIFSLSAAWFIGAGITSAIFLWLEHRINNNNQNDEVGPPK